MSNATRSPVEGTQPLQVTLQILSTRQRVQTPPFQLMLLAGALPKERHLNGTFAPKSASSLQTSIKSKAKQKPCDGYPQDKPLLTSQVGQEVAGIRHGKNRANRGTDLPDHSSSAVRVCTLNATRGRNQDSSRGAGRLLRAPQSRGSSCSEQAEELLWTTRPRAHQDNVALTAL